MAVSVLYNDNQLSLSTFKDTADKLHFKDVGVHVYQIRKLIKDGNVMVMEYCGTDNMMADGLTMPLVRLSTQSLLRCAV